MEIESGEKGRRKGRQDQREEDGYSLFKGKEPEGDEMSPVPSSPTPVSLGRDSPTWT